MVEGGEFDSQIMRVLEAAFTLNAALWECEEAIASEFMSVKQFKGIVEAQLGVKISMNRLKVHGDHVRGAIEMIPGQPIGVYVVANLSPFDERWVEIKELCQAYLDVLEDYSMKGRDTLSRLDANFQLGSSQDRAEHRAYFSELLAYALAGELLYPIDLRRKDLKRLENGETSIDAIADRLNVPRMLVDRLLNPAAHAWWEEGYQLFLDQQAAKQAAK
jgi:hypothetical protein